MSLAVKAEFEDGNHPNDLGFYRMADVIGKVLAEVIHCKKTLALHK